MKLALSFILHKTALSVWHLKYGIVRFQETSKLRVFMDNIVWRMYLIIYSTGYQLNRINL